MYSSYCGNSSEESLDTMSNKNNIVRFISSKIDGHWYYPEGDCYIPDYISSVPSLDGFNRVFILTYDTDIDTDIDDISHDKKNNVYRIVTSNKHVMHGTMTKNSYHKYYCKKRKGNWYYFGEMKSSTSNNANCNEVCCGCGIQ